MKSKISNGMKKIFKTLPYIVLSLLVGFTAVYATSKLTPPGAVSNTMYSLSDIYNLASGTTATEGTGTIQTTPSLSETGKTLTEVYTAISTEIAKLSSSVIASGTTAFGITGDTDVVDTSSGDATVNDIITGKKAWVDGVEVTGTATAGTNYGIPKTGQTGCWNASGTSIPCALTGQDGDTLKGVAFSYTDNSNGTITDNTTGLIWQKQDDGVGKTWDNALAYCNANTAGLPDTGWRLPNIKELQSIVDFSRVEPSINITSFPNSQSDGYWSSTSYQDPGDESDAWVVNFGYGSISNIDKTDEYFVRCVR